MLSEKYRWQEGSSYGSADTLLANYEKWKSNLRALGDDGKLVLALGPIRGMSKQFLNARGSASLNLFDGRLTVAVDGLPATDFFDVWLVDNLPGPGKSVRPERGDAMLRVGRLEADGSQLKLQTQLQHKQLSDFRLDLVVVAPAGESPEDGAFLFGSPGLFQRLYYSSPQGQLVRLGGDDYQVKGDLVEAVSIPFRTLVPQPAYAAESVQSASANLVKLGEQLFFQETFKGNGRTCGTCHPAENNFTLDPAFIATLPPKNPLFVAEFIPALKENFEKPALMRKHALILENLDGFDNLPNKFVMRAIPHTLALSISLCPRSRWLHHGPAGSKDGLEWRWSAGRRLLAIVCHRRGHATFYTDTRTASGRGLRSAHRCPTRRLGSVSTIAGPKQGIEFAAELQATSR